MKSIKLLILFCLAFITIGSFTPMVFANFSEPHPTVLPGTEKKMSECELIMNYVNWYTTEQKVKDEDLSQEENESGISYVTYSTKEMIAKRMSFPVTGIDADVPYTDVLGCAIKTGDIKLWMIPFYIRYLLEFVIGLAGLICVGGFIYGGYMYLFSGLSQDKEKGKGAIKNAVIGLVLTLVAWAVVNIVMSLLTS